MACGGTEPIGPLRKKHLHPLFLVGLLLLALQRLLEVRVSERHASRLLRRGGREHAPDQYQIMKVLHSSWFVAMLLEVILLRRRLQRPLAFVTGLLFALGQTLRYAAIRTLGQRWTARVVTLPGAPPVTDGIYRYVRHPNYLGVILEIAAVPLMHGAYWTAFLYSVANLLLLRARIRAEEEALGTDNGYWRFVEGGRRWGLSGLHRPEPNPTENVTVG